MRCAYRISAVLMALAAATGASGQALNYPTRPVRIVVPFPAGGPTDIQARLIARKLNEGFGQPVVVENRPGAGSMIGVEVVTKAAPDGYTLLLGTISVVVAPLAYAKPLFDPLRDLTPIAQVSTGPYLMIVHPSLPVRSVREFIELARSRPGQINYSSSGSGTPPHLAGELLKLNTGIDLVHIPYKGAGPAMNDLLAGQVSMSFTNPIIALAQARAGKVRALAVTTPRRAAATPEIPTMIESGAPGVEVASWFALLAPAGTPRDIVNRLNAVTVGVLGQPEIRSRFEADGSEAVGGTPDQLGAFMRSEWTKWGKVIKAIGLKME